MGPIASDMRRTERVTVNITHDERFELIAEGESLSDFVREIALRFLGRQSGR